MYLKQLALGPMQNFVYLVGDPQTKEAAVVDPAWNVPAILQQAQDDGYRITHALLSICLLFVRKYPQGLLLH